MIFIADYAHFSCPRGRLISKTVLAAALLSAVPMAMGHIVLEQPRATSGSSYKAVLRVGHGCAGSPTQQIVVEIPPGVQGAKPMPKPGWVLGVTRAALAQPYQNHGRTLTDDVVRISWTARSEADQLPDAHFDEFVLQAQLPEQTGALYWPVRQECAQGRHDWVQVPAPGQQRRDLKEPAPLLELVPHMNAPTPQGTTTQAAPHVHRH